MLLSNQTKMGALCTGMTFLNWLAYCLVNINPTVLSGFNHFLILNKPTKHACCVHVHTTNRPHIPQTHKLINKETQFKKLINEETQLNPTPLKQSCFFLCAYNFYKRKQFKNEK